MGAGSRQPSDLVTFKLSQCPLLPFPRLRLNEARAGAGLLSEHCLNPVPYPCDPVSLALRSTTSAGWEPWSAPALVPSAGWLSGGGARVLAEGRAGAAGRRREGRLMRSSALEGRLPEHSPPSAPQPLAVGGPRSRRAGRLGCPRRGLSLGRQRVQQRGWSGAGAGPGVPFGGTRPTRQAAAGRGCGEVGRAWRRGPGCPTPRARSPSPGREVAGSLAKATAQEFQEAQGPPEAAEREL